MLTTIKIAEILNLTPQRVRTLARNRKVGRKVGRDWLFDPKDIDRLRPGKVGRPRKEP